MQAHPTTRRSRATPAGNVLTIVLALWINLAVQPCAMAMGTGSDCPHCPPAVEDTLAMAHGHHGQEDDSDCASLGTDCGDIDDFGVDSRGAQSKVKDKAQIAVPAPLPSGELPIVPVAIPIPATGLPDPAVAPPPLHLLNCVFLD